MATGIWILIVGLALCLFGVDDKEVIAGVIITLVAIIYFCTQVGLLDDLL